MGKGKGIGGHQKHGAPVEWLTPPQIVKDLGPFDLDPCCPPTMPWQTAKTMWLVGGLQDPWHGRVWLNPPYGTETGRWLKKLADHGDGIAIIFARTETEMFHRQVWERATVLFFFEGRLHFHRPNGERAPANAGAPSVLVAYGRNNGIKLREYALKHKGYLVQL